MNKPELLAPAGNLEKLKIAIMYGADAVYLGGKKFSLRSSASNFEIDDIKNGVEFAKKYQAKVYVVVNMIMHNQDLEGLKEYLEQLEEIGVNGVICADLLVVDYLKKYAPKLEIHISTQQSITNSYAIKFYEKLGANRVVLAREISKNELKELVEKSNVEIEYFVHGAMCVAYSGRCMLSNYYSKRDSNRGGCSQSCRWNYDLLLENNDEKTKINNEDSYFTMSSKDLNLAQKIPELIDMGVSSLKIEGRMKSIYYLATIISTYRKIIDDYLLNKENFVYKKEYDDNLSKAANRAINTGFYDNDMNYEKQLYQCRDEHPTKEFIGFVLDYDEKYIKLEQRNYFEKGDKVELFGPNKEFYSFVVDKIYDEDMNEISVARHPQQIVYLPFDKTISKCSMLRKVI
ncbi:putative protease [Bacilli bacterium PM5-3]|nr:putative protease [Bacilli bacterium PM5-3]